MRCWSIFSLKVLRVSMVWVRSGVHLTVQLAALIRSGVRFGVWSEVFIQGSGTSVVIAMRAHLTA
jgi:hypothetical protein